MMHYAALKKVSLFAGLDDSALQAIAARMTIRAFPAKAIILNEGDDTDSLYLLLSGKVKIYSSDEEGKEIVLDMLGPNDYFGELAVIDEEPRSASVITLEPCKLAVISRKNFLLYLASEPCIAINLLKTVVRKLRRETQNVKSLALMDVYGRTAKLLLELAEQQDGRATVERLSYREIATRIGASREMVGRIFKDLKRGGYITVEQGKIIITENLPDHW